MKKFVYFVSMALVFLGINACKPEEPAGPALEGLAFKTTEVELAVGDVYTLELTITPADAVYDGLLWASSDEAVASVSDDGEVTAVSAGTADITVNSGEISATCKVTVKENREQVEMKIEVRALSANEAEVTVSAVHGHTRRKGQYA